MKECETCETRSCPTCDKEINSGVLACYAAGAILLIIGLIYLII